jgi:hypothetical protein
MLCRPWNLIVRANHNGIVCAPCAGFNTFHWSPSACQNRAILVKRACVLRAFCPMRHKVALNSKG